MITYARTFSSCQRFSIGFESGLSGGVFHQLIPFSSMNWHVALEVCFGSLSCINLWPLGYFCSRNGNNPLFSISMYTLASMIPLNTTTSVAPFQLMPAHTCNFRGCLGRGFGFGLCPPLRQHCRLWLSSCTVVSSVQTTSTKSSWRYCCAHCSRFSLLASRISWQYADPRKVHPSFRLMRTTVGREISIPCRSKYWCSCVAVVSSFICMYASTKAITRPSTFDGLPDPGRLPILPSSRKDCQNLHTACLDVSISSCCKHRAISENPSPVLFSTRIRCCAYNDRRAICVSYQLRTYVQTCTASQTQKESNNWTHSSENVRTFYALCLRLRLRLRFAVTGAILDRLRLRF